MTLRKPPSQEPRASGVVSEEPVPTDYQLRLQQRPYAPSSTRVLVEAHLNRLRECSEVEEPKS